MTGTTCTIRGCAARSCARGLCRKHYQAAWKAGKLTAHPKPAHPKTTGRRDVCPPHHKHAASTTCYIQHRCGCVPCRDYNLAREIRRSKDIAYGRYDSGLVDAAPVREHVLALSEYGIGYKRTAQLAGVHTTTVRQLVWGREDGARKGELVKRMKRANAEKILAVRPNLESLGARHPVPAGSSVRRVKALGALGWSMSAIAGHLGVAPSNFTLVREWDTASPTHRARTVTVGAGTALAIAALYDRLSNTPPPTDTHHQRVAVSRTRNAARAAGWPLPMDWEAVDNDFDRPATVRRSAA